MSSSTSSQVRRGGGGHGEEAKNVFGEPLELCCTSPVTGFYRDGFCKTGPQDHGKHLICAKVTDEWLKFSKSKGNDLITPRPEFRFSGLKAGDCWCLCVMRWKEAYDAGKAPPIKLKSCHIKALDMVPLEILKEFDYSENSSDGCC